MNNALNEQLRDFYKTYRQELFAYALSITGCTSAAEDAVHTAFGRALGADRIPREWRPYLFRCVRNAALDTLRAAQRETRKWKLYAECSAADPPEVNERQEVVETALAALPENERECIVLKIYSGLTFQEIARVRGVPQGTAASWYWRGLAKLRETLEKTS